MLDDLDMIDMWQGVNYDVADIHRFLRDEAARPVAYTQVPAPGSWKQSWKLSAWDTPPARPSALRALNYLLKNWIVKLRFILSGGKKVETNSKKIPFVIFSDDKRYWNVFCLLYTSRCV